MRPYKTQYVLTKDERPAAQDGPVVWGESVEAATAEAIKVLGYQGLGKGDPDEDPWAFRVVSVTEVPVYQ